VKRPPVTGEAQLLMDVYVLVPEDFNRTPIVQVGHGYYTGPG